MALIGLPIRLGERPETIRLMPHTQTSQKAPPEMQEALFARCAALPGVTVGDSLISVPGARAFHLDPAMAGPPDAFIRGHEFAHLHPAYDGSLHLRLPQDQAAEVVETGWGEFHPLVEEGALPPVMVMVYGPRDADDLEQVWRIVEASYQQALRHEQAPPGV